MIPTPTARMCTGFAVRDKRAQTMPALTLRMTTLTTSTIIHTTTRILPIHTSAVWVTLSIGTTQTETSKMFTKRARKTKHVPTIPALVR